MKKTFTTQEIRGLLDRVMVEEISFSRMVEIMNKRVSEAEKLCVEDIQKRKFKKGDKVRIKDGISSKTHRCISPNFTSMMNEFIGKELTVKKYSGFGWVEFYEDDYGYQFHEDWLEPYVEEPKVGDWVIFWDYSPKLARVGILTGINSDSLYNYRIDEGVHWMYAVKWDGTKEHLEEVRKDKI